MRSGGGRAGESFQAIGDRTLIGRSPECDVFLDDVTVSRRHAELDREGTFTIRDLGSLNGTFVNRRRIESAVLEDDDEVQIGKYRMTFLLPMSTTTEPGAAARLHTIGAVCERLRDEFPDISISKIRYLEDQGLLQPSRTRGGYRLFSEADVERLVTILRLQRDEFLPLRVIREELRSPSADRAKRRAAGLRGQEDEIDMSDLCERAGISAEFARQLEDFSLLAPRIEEASASTARARRTSRSPAPRSPATGSTHDTCGHFAQPQGASRRCSSRSSRPHFALATWSGARPRSRTSRPGGVAQELAQLLLTRDLREVAER